MISVPELSTVIKEYKIYENAFLPKIVKIPLVQKNGCTFKAVVNNGDAVKEGDIIATGSDKDGNVLNVHSSIPGTVLDCIPTICPDGKYDYAIRIKLDGNFLYLGKKLQESDVNLISSDTIVSRLIENGTVNTFLIDTTEYLGLQLKKYSVSENKNLVVRLFDEDRYRVTDSLVSKFFLEQVLLGAKAIKKAGGIKNVIFACSKKCDFVERLENCDIDNKYILKINNQKYPNGFKRELTYAFNKTQKKNSDFQVSEDDLFIDSSTLYEVYKAVILNKPSMERLVQFTGNCIYSSCLLNVKIGTSIREIVDQIGGFEKVPNLVVINGHETGSSVSDLDVPVTKYTKSVAFVSSKKNTDSNIYACMKCGNCRTKCPVKLSPDLLYSYSVNEGEISESFLRASVMCNGCGICNTVCPSRLPLAQMISIIKQKIEGEE